MRVPIVLMVCLALFLGSCSSKKGGVAPPPLNKEWLLGKWKSATSAPFFTGCEFSGDGTMKMTVQGMKKPITSRYVWSDDRKIEVEYPNEVDLRKAYEAAAKSYKDEIDDGLKKGKMFDKAAAGLLGMVVDKLPEKETFVVGISDPRILILVRGNTPLNFEKAD